MAQNMGIPAGAIQFTDRYKYILGQPATEVRNMYVAMDLLANPAKGEGFGIPILEAQATGTPVITSNWTAMPELTMYGDIVEGQLFYSNQDSWQMTPDIGAIADVMEALYNESESKRLELGEITAAEVKDHYHADVVFEKYWIPALDILKERLRDRKTKAE
jgi:glycosyltransferase involved in cell wall biosynthesis